MAEIGPWQTWKRSPVNVRSRRIADMRRAFGAGDEGMGFATAYRVLTHDRQNEFREFERRENIRALIEVQSSRAAALQPGSALPEQMADILGAVCVQPVERSHGAVNGHVALDWKV